MKRTCGAALGVVRVMAFGLLAGAVAESVSAEVNLLRDGGFEFDPGCTYDWQKVTELDAWTVESGNVDKICKYWVSHGGEQSLDLVGTADGIISQAFSTTPGEEYKLVVWYSGNPYDQGYRSARVDIVGGDVPSFVLGWDPEVKANFSADMGWRSHVVVFKAKGGAATLRLASLGGGGYGGIALDDISVTRYRGVASPAAETTSVRPPELSGDRRFDGSYFNSEFSFGFRIAGNQGVTTVSNSPLYQVGDVMLRFTSTGPRSFRGEQFCVDGIFHPVTAELSPGGDLEMTIEGCSPNRYTMVRQGDSARESNPKQLPSTDVLGGCGSAKWQRLAVPEYVCFSPYGGTLPWVNVCNIALSTGYTPVYLGEACNAHDSCYGSGGTTRSRCDLAFRVLLETTCDLSLTGKMWKYGRRNCWNVASEFYYQVSTRGCDAFKAAQAAAGNVRAACD